jgi:hypothetical protein
MDSREEERILLSNLAASLPELEQLRAACSDHWGYEDPIYRFYHQSHKVYALQGTTQRIVGRLQALAPQRPLNAWFMEIVQRGTGRTFSVAHNANWTEHTRPIVEAFFHARYFLEMLCRYGRTLQEPPDVLPSGWAAVLCLYGLR